jgi:putative ABC transport system permease protein
MKYILKNIAEKKLRTAIVILSVAISSALFFSSISISDTMVKVQMVRWKSAYGDTDITIRGWWASPTKFFSQSPMEDLKENFQYAVGTLTGFGLYEKGAEKNKGINLLGTDVNEFRQITNINLIKGSSTEIFQGNKIIISKITASKYELEIGDSMLININGSKHKFLITGITEQTGPFIGEGDSPLGMIPIETLQGIYGVRGRIDKLYLKSKSPELKQELILLLRQRYPMYNVREPFTEEEIRIETDKIKIPFLVLTLILSFMSIYIINSTFKIITLERLPVIGTFRSIGATKRSTNSILLLESLLYGVFGALLGMLLGLGILFAMSIYTMPSWEEGYKASIDFKAEYLLYSFILAVAMSLISSISPIRKVSKLPVKDIVLNKLSPSSKKVVGRFLYGILLLAISISCSVLIEGNYSAIINALSIVLVMASIILMIPQLTNLILKLFEGIYEKIFGNEGVLAVKSLKGNKSFYGSVSLLSIGISSLLLVSTLSYSTLKQLLDYYERSDYDIYLSAKNVNGNFLSALKSVEGVHDVYKVMGVGDAELPEYKDLLKLTQGVEAKRLFQYMDLEIEGDRENILKQLESERSILLTKRLKNRYLLKEGDSIVIRMWGRSFSYKVIGFFDSIESGGSYGVIGDKYLKSDFGWKDYYYSTLLIKTNKTAEEVDKNIKERFARQEPYIITLEKLRDINIKYNKQIYDMAKAFSVLTMLSGIFALFNNLIMNLLERRKALAMYRSVGMSKRQLLKMILIETFTIGLIGGIVGTSEGVLVTKLAQRLSQQLDMNIDIYFSSTNLVWSVILAVAVALIASIVPSIKSSKLNLIEAVKYE